MDTDWLISIGSLLSTCLARWFDLFNHNPYEQKDQGRIWLIIRTQALQTLWASAHILMHALNNFFRPYGRQLAAIRNFFSPRSANSIASVQVHIFAKNMRDIIIYIVRWCQKHLSKQSLIKYTCSLRDKLIIVWTLNRQGKIFLRIRDKTFLICHVTSYSKAIKSHMKLWVGVPYTKSPLCQAWWL